MVFKNFVYKKIEYFGGIIINSKLTLEYMYFFSPDIKYIDVFTRTVPWIINLRTCVYFDTNYKYLGVTELLATSCVPSTGDRINRK